VVLVGDLLSAERAGTKCGPFGSALKRYEYVGTGVPVWGIDNVLPNEFVEENSLFITESKFQEIRAYEVQHGDVLISRAGTVGRMCIANPIQSPSIIGTNLIRVVLNRQLMIPEYFVVLFTYFPNRVAQLRANGKTDSYSFMNTGTLSQLKIPVPPIELQGKFCRLLRSIANLRQKQRTALRLCEDLRQSLTARLF